MQPTARDASADDARHWARDVLAACRELTATESAVVRAVYFEHRPITGVARRLGIPAADARAAAARALITLGRRLEQPRPAG